MNSIEIKNIIGSRKSIYIALRLVKRLVLLIPRFVALILREAPNRKIIGFREWLKLIFYKTLLLLLHGNLRSLVVERKHKIISNFLFKHYQVLNKDNIPIPDVNYYKECIWVCWLQGEENAPNLIRICINQIREQSNGHRVILISLKNYSEYVTIPQDIVDKYQKGILLPAHFSDLIRYQLLYRYGGAWLDSTIFATQPIGSNKEFEYDFYSARFKEPLEDDCIAKCRWVTPLVFCKAGNGLIYNLYRIFEKYNCTYNSCIDYLLVDYIIDFIVQSNEIFYLQLQNIPYNNEDFKLLHCVFNKMYDEVAYKKMLTSDTHYYKLTYKAKYVKNICGNETFFGHFYKDFS